MRGELGADPRYSALERSARDRVFRAYVSEVEVIKDGIKLLTCTLKRCDTGGYLVVSRCLYIHACQDCVGIQFRSRSAASHITG